MTDKLVVQTKVDAEEELLRAERLSSQYGREVVTPAIKKLEAELAPKLEGQPWIRFTATLDGRYSRLGPKEPYPDVQPREYQIRLSGTPGIDGKHYIMVEEWHRHGHWVSPYSSGDPGWRHVEGWHKLQVLEHVAQREPKRDPGVWHDAMTMLVEFCQRAAKDNLLGADELAALNTVQAHHRDKAMYRDRL